MIFQTKQGLALLAEAYLIVACNFRDLGDSTGFGKYLDQRGWAVEGLVCSGWDVASNALTLVALLIW